MKFAYAAAGIVAASALVACGRKTWTTTAAAAAPSSATSSTNQAVRSRPREAPRLRNRIAYIPPQCFADTSVGEASANPCYVCHVDSDAPNFTNDADLQLRLTLPPVAAKNPWRNLFDPPYAREASHAADEEVLAHVRESNYFDARGDIALALRLKTPPSAWDENQNGTWDGFIPDARFAFDDRGFDRNPDGSLTGWRAFAYYPMPGAFLPTNGSIDDVLVRLAPVFREDEHGKFDRAIYEINLAIVEALVRRKDVPIDPADETALGVDLDRDGRLSHRSTRVAFDEASDVRGTTRMHFVGRGKIEEEKGTIALAPGLYPIGTEFLHTVRYLDVRPDGSVAMAARMKEVRYARKARWSSYAIAKANAANEAREQEEASDGVHDVRWQPESGSYNARGWKLAGFIEAADGSLRPQTYEETAYCEGCHGGIGATVDSTFAFARKIDDDPARGWFHWSTRDLRGIAEPRRRDGAYEYTFYLSQTHAGDDWGANTEVTSRFFDARGGLREDAIERLHRDVAELLLPSAARAIDLDRAYAAIVKTQSFEHGRDPLLTPAPRAHETVTIGRATNVPHPVAHAPLVPKDHPMRHTDVTRTPQ